MNTFGASALVNAYTATTSKAGQNQYKGANEHYKGVFLKCGNISQRRCVGTVVYQGTHRSLEKKILKSSL